MYTIENKVQLIGTLDANPEIRTIENGEKHARFNLGVTDVYNDDQGNKVTETHWHRIVAWGKLAEIAEKYLIKGAEVAVSGKLVNRSYDDKDRIKRCVTEVQINEILRLEASTSKQST